MGILGLGLRRGALTKEQLLQRKALIASKLSQVTAKMANAKRTVVREMFLARINMLNSRLDKINENLAKLGEPQS